MGIRTSFPKGRDVRFSLKAIEGGKKKSCKWECEQPPQGERSILIKGIYYNLLYKTSNKY